jgi:CopG family nickel-responsive transcriptional regulator
MQRVTITLDDDLVAGIDQLVESRGYQGRSEAMRDLARAGLREAAEDDGRTGDCVAALVYVFDHHARDLAKRLTRVFHDHHDLTISTLHVHLDHDTCMEVSVLRGNTAAVRHVGDHVIAERGVQYGRLVMAPAEIEGEIHSHGGAKPRRHTHTHVRKPG